MKRLALVSTAVISLGLAILTVWVVHTVKLQRAELARFNHWVICEGGETLYYGPPRSKVIERDYVSNIETWLCFDGSTLTLPTKRNDS